MQNRIHHLNNKKWDVKIRETNENQKYLHLFYEFLFRCLIFDNYNISNCEKGKVKDEASETNCETNEE